MVTADSESGTPGDGSAATGGASDAGYRYDTHDPSVYGNAMGRYKTARQLAFVQELVGSRGARIVDVGGGAGRLAIPLARLGHDVTVVDPSAEALGSLAQRSGGKVRTVCGDLMSFAPQRSYDAALLVDTLKYLRDTPVERALAKLASLVGPGGLVVVAEINGGSWRNRVSELAGRRRGLPYRIDSAAGYRRALRGAGLEVVRERGMVWMPLPFNSDSRLVGVLARAETLLGLDRWIGQSPWLLIGARRPGGDRAGDQPRTTAGESAPAA